MSVPRRGGWTSAALLALVLSLAAPVAADWLDETRQTVEDGLASLPEAPPAPEVPPVPEVPPAPELPPAPEAPDVEQTVEAASAAAEEGVQQATDQVPTFDPDELIQQAEAAVDEARDQADEARDHVESLITTSDGTMDTNGDDAAPVAVESPVAAAVAAAATLAVGAGASFIAFWLAGSSGTLGAGAAAARSTDLRKLLPFASPLFTRFSKETVLGHPRREAIYALILQTPGISLQSIGDSSGLSRTAVLHHLRLLEQQHLIVSLRKGRSRHYYENGGRFGHDQKDAFAILQNDRSKAVAETIRSNPGILQKGLCEAMGIQPSIAHWHVKRLVDARLVEAVHQGRTVSYFPAAALTGLREPIPAPALLATVPTA